MSDIIGQLVCSLRSCLVRLYHHNEGVVPMLIFDLVFTGSEDQIENRGVRIHRTDPGSKIFLARGLANWKNL